MSIWRLTISKTQICIDNVHMRIVVLGYLSKWSWSFMFFVWSDIKYLRRLIQILYTIYVDLEINHF